MPSIIEGYNYDIFISYRQKDNKHDGWVTKFVDNLKGELEATFKEDVSVYFDINPTDGLLETDSVDKSLADKLKCLIFIPIISRTYCDPKSYAWQHEFCAFNKLAKEDKFGRDIRLSSGNVASRILPVKIHDLDPEDKTLIENELGEMLRGIEFIYKEAGVNRPLKPNDDAKENLNRTHYRNQVNKVANTVKEIISALKKQVQHPEVVSKEVSEVKPIPPKNRKTKIFTGSLTALVLIFFGIFFLPKFIEPTKQLEKSIAVLPFLNESPVDSNKYFINGIMEEVLTNLQKIKNFRVLSRTSTDQYKDQVRPTIPEIAKKLGVNFIIEGSGQKIGNTFRLRVQLIKAKGKETHLWAKSYEQELRETKDLFSLQSQIAQAVATELKTIITPEENQIIEKIPTSNMTAYDLYLKATDYTNDYQKTRNLSSYQTAVNLYNAVLEIDSAFTRAYTGLASAYYRRYYYETYFKEGFLDSMLVLANKALSIDDQLDEAYYLQGQYYLNNGQYTEALDNFDKALKNNPNYYSAYERKGYILTWILMDFVIGIDNYNKALTLIQGDERTSLLNNLGRAYLDIGFIDKAKYYYQEVFALDKDSASYLGKLAWIEYNLENFEEALRLAKRANEIDSTRLIAMEYYYYLPSVYYQEAYLNANKWVEYYKKTGALPLAYSYRIGYAFWQVGKQKEAEYYFNQQIKYDEEKIKLGRSWSNTSYYGLAAIYAFGCENVKAYKYLDEFYKNWGDKYSLWWTILIKHDPFFSSIRNEERFQKKVKNIEAKYQAEHERVKKWLEEQGEL